MPRHSRDPDAGAPRRTIRGLLIESDGEKAFFIADLVADGWRTCRSRDHGVRRGAAGDLESKRRILKGAVEEDWLIVFEHDPLVAWGSWKTTAKATGSWRHRREGGTNYRSLAERRLER